MKKVFILFNSTGKIYQFETGLTLKPGDGVLAELEQIVEEGKVVGSPQNMEIEESSGKVLRKFTDEDKLSKKALKQKARDFIEEAQKKVVRHGLKMTILDADLSFDERKLTFYFSSEGRVDFRSLVSDMAKSFDKLIRLQQVGGRQAAKYCGGIGMCGRELCCSKFLENTESITLEMAEAQELSCAGSQKLTGCCGKLMCCLGFEIENYKELKKKMPKINSNFKSPEGEGTVIGHNLLEGKVILKTKDNKKIEVQV